MNCTFHGDYPQWEYRKESKLRDICAKTYREYSGKDAVSQEFMPELNVDIWQKNWEIIST